MVTGGDQINCLAFFSLLFFGLKKSSTRQNSFQQGEFSQPAVISRNNLMTTSQRCTNGFGR